MNSNDFRQEIDLKKPKYLAKYYDLINIISNKGSSTGGDYVSFGPFFHTYMYAFMIGYHIGECSPITGCGETKDFAAIGHWKPNELADYILMLVLSEPVEKLGFTWADLEDMSDEDCKNAVSCIIKRIEGYANTGLNYIQERFNNERNDFHNPFVYIDMLKELIDSKG